MCLVWNRHYDVDLRLHFGIRSSLTGHTLWQNGGSFSLTKGTVLRGDCSRRYIKGHLAQLAKLHVHMRFWRFGVSGATILDRIIRRPPPPPPCSAFTQGEARRKSYIPANDKVARSGRTSDKLSWRSVRNFEEYVIYYACEDICVKFLNGKSAT